MSLAILEAGPAKSLASDSLTLPCNTKIVATLGPACAALDKVRELVAAGVNVFRLNFSHSDHSWHEELLARVRQAGAEAGVSVAVLQDLCGPKIRVSQLRSNPLLLSVGDRLVVTTDKMLDHAEHPTDLEFDIATTYDALVDDLEPGNIVLLDDGKVALRVVEKYHDRLIAVVMRGKQLTRGKGMNLPGSALSTPSLTDKDWRDLEWGIAHHVDFVALSFVRSAADVQMVRARINAAGSPARLIAKIERPEAVDCLSAILEAADGLMVARGDLGLETDLARVPLLQKELIDRCRLAGKPVITATQMLESMIDSPTPTRAEVSDVANAIFDGTDAIMVSGETATGSYGREVIEVITRVARATESGLPRRDAAASIPTPAEVLIEAATLAAHRLHARGVVVYTPSGDTARLAARQRLSMPVLALTNEPSTYRQLSLSYGIRPHYVPCQLLIPQILAEVDRFVAITGWARPGELFVVAISLDGDEGHASTLHFHRISGDEWGDAV